MYMIDVGRNVAGVPCIVLNSTALCCSTGVLYYYVHQCHDTESLDTETRFMSLLIVCEISP